MRPFAVVFLLIITILFFENVSTVSAQFLEAGVEKLEQPIDAPDIKLKILGGGEISIKELKGKVILLQFFSPYMSVCQEAAVALDKLHDAIKTKDLVIFHVAIEGREKDLIKFRDKHAISLPILIDGNKAAARAYRVSGYPETFFINRQGKIVGKAFWEEDWTSKSMKDLIKFLLGQQK
jgi:cytochrome c biogenesis protein CcmG/thiol:disulfide interchange protein DsbE